MIAILAVFVATLIASSRLLRLVFEDIDVIAYVGLFIACWIGAGGALVPVPGVRPISWFMVIQQSAALSPLIVIALATSAMVLGQSSYFAATRAALRRQARAGLQGDPGAEPASPEPAPAEPVPAGPEPDEGGPAGGGPRAFLTRMKDGVEGRVRRHATSTAFLVSALPSPMTTVATTASASAGTAYAKWVVPTFCGYLVFVSILAGVGQALFQGIRGLVT